MILVSLFLTGGNIYFMGRTRWLIKNTKARRGPSSNFLLSDDLNNCFTCFFNVIHTTPSFHPTRSRGNNVLSKTYINSLLTVSLSLYHNTKGLWREIQ